MSDWAFLFTAVPLGIAVVLLAFAVTNFLTHDRATTIAIMVAVASGVGYAIGRLEN